MDPIVVEVEVACSPGHAFRTWTHRATKWWPPGHSVSGHADLEVTFEPRAGGRIFERTPDGTEHDWGQVVAWEPPGRLAYLWHLVFDPAEATDVEITFTPAGAGTLVRIVHSGWERLGAAAEERRARNRAGWSGVLPEYQAACAR